MRYVLKKLKYVYLFSAPRAYFLKLRRFTQHALIAAENVYITRLGLISSAKVNDDRGIEPLFGLLFKVHFKGWTLGDWRTPLIFSEVNSGRFHEGCWYCICAD